MAYINIQNGNYSPLKSEIMPFAATWMDLDIITLNEVSQLEKDKYHMITLLCGKILQMNLSTKQLEILGSALRLC